MCGDWYITKCLCVCHAIICMYTIITARYAQIQDQYNEAVHSIQEQKQLITQLEEDLRSVNALSSMFRGDAEVMCSGIV